MTKKENNPTFTKNGFGAKISVTAYLYVLLTMVFTLVLYFTVLRHQVEKAKFNFLTEAGESKKQEITNSYNYKLEKLENFANSDATKSMVENLIISFRKYETENASYFDPSVASEFKNILKEYYTFELLEKSEKELPPAQKLVPKDELSVAFQFIFMVENPHPLNEKYKLNSLNDGTSFGRFHSMYHNTFLNFTNEMNFKDIYVIDIKTGRVVYNVNKNLATGSDLYTGLYRQSGLAMAFKEVTSSTSNEIFLEDFSEFLPSYNSHSAFIGIPITRYGVRTGVIIAEIDRAYFTDLYSSSVSSEKNNEIEYDLIGEDLSLKTIPELTEKLSPDDSPEKASITDKNKAFDEIFYPDNFQTLLTDKEAEIISKDFTEDKHLMHITPITFSKTQWYQVTKTHKKGVIKQLKDVLILLLIGYFVLGLALIFSVRGLRVNYTQRIKGLIESMKLLLNGNISKDIVDNNGDTVSETVYLYNKLKQRIEETTKFSHDLSVGNYTTNFDSKSENDVLASSLTTLKNTLLKNQEKQEVRDKEDEVRKWINDGIAAFNDYLRQNNHDINLLSDLIIDKLVHYINANQGGVFIIDEENSDEKVLHLIASYAYDRKKFLQKSLNASEGLIGNCYLEKKPVYLKDIPEDYLDIRSGLGSAKPKSIYIIPLMVDDEVMGIIELASLYELEQKDFEFLSKVIDNIAATFKTVRLNTKTNELLEISKRRANEISQQEEEMRQNMEEMQATQEELARLRQEDEKRTNELIKQIDDTKLVLSGIINSVDGELYIKDDKDVIVYANEQFTQRVQLHIDDILGKTLESIISQEHVAKEKETDQEAFIDGITSWNETETRKGEEVSFRLTKRRFYIDTVKANGILFTRVKS